MFCSRNSQCSIAKSIFTVFKDFGFAILSFWYIKRSITSHCYAFLILRMDLTFYGSYLIGWPAEKAPFHGMEFSGTCGTMNNGNSFIPI